MRGVARRVVFVCVSVALAAACTSESDLTSVEPPAAGNLPPYRVGQPYEENGRWYYPHPQPDYDEVGVASWYGPGFDGRLTADGEVYDANGLTAAHPTLPMPVNVRVTDLDNGRSLVLRVNDRGPFARGRIIDVSARAAQLLGFYEKGTAHVRVTYVDRAGEPAAAPAGSTAVVVASAVPTVPVQMAALDPATVGPIADAQTQPDAIPAGDAGMPELYVQAAAFSDLRRAERCRRRLAAAGTLTISSIDRDGELLYTVRLGPFDDIEAANAALSRLAELGESGAKIVADR